jgi:hypothetical protein
VTGEVNIFIFGSHSKYISRAGKIREGRDVCLEYSVMSPDISRQELLQTVREETGSANRLKRFAALCQIEIPYKTCD